MEHLHESEAFREWLLRERGLSERAAADVLSRCRRVQRVLGVSLAIALRSDRGLQRVLDRLEGEAADYLQPGSNPTFAAGVLRTAARHYRDFISAAGKGNG